MTQLTNEEVYQRICLLGDIDIQEGHHGEDYDRIEFNFAFKPNIGSGHYERIGDTINFHILYQIEGEELDIEHIRQDGCEYVVMGVSPYTGKTTIENDVVTKIEVIDADGKVKYSFSTKKDQRFLTLDTTEH